MISIVVPVYNCEKFLKRSIESLINQTIFNQLEIIYVDDGSVDNSFQILQDYSARYNNMQVIHQKNSGVSAARNNGIKASSGEYVSFFDADDVARPTLYEKLYGLCKSNNADISVVDYSMVFDEKHAIKHRKDICCVYDNRSDMLKAFLKGNTVCTNPVDKMFSAQIVKAISFPDGYAIGEDMYFVFKALQLAHKVVIDSRESLYLYYIRNNSAMKSSFSEKHMDGTRLSKLILAELRNEDILSEYAEANYIHEVCKMLNLLYKSDNKDIFQDKVTEYYLDLKRYSIFKAARYMSRKHVLALELMKLSPKLYNYIYAKLRIG